MKIGIYYFAALALYSVSHVSGNCVLKQIRKPNDCRLDYNCQGHIKLNKLPIHCRDSSNTRVVLHVTVNDASETIYHDTHYDSISSINSLNIFGNIDTIDLPITDFLPSLQRLVISANLKYFNNSSPFFNLFALETLDLSHNQLSEIDQLFKFEISPTKLKTLSLAFNKISQLDDSTFSDLGSLTELDLSNNQLTVLSENNFVELMSLEKLKLSHNEIGEFQGNFSSLYNLKYLDLKGNLLTEIDPFSLMNVKDLETFDVSENALKTLHPDLLARHWNHFDGEVHYCSMKFSGNNITILRNSTIAVTRRDILKKLDLSTVLDLSDNDISEIEYNAFHSIARLTSLDLSMNPLETLIVNPVDLVDLKFLNMSQNMVTMNSFESFIPMKSLVNLDLSSNQLGNIPNDIFFKNYNLMYLNLSHNELQKINDFRIGFRNGGLLDLSNNGLKWFHLNKEDGMHLSKLTISSNEINSMDSIDLRSQEELVTLEIAENQISYLDKNSFKLPKHLTALDLSHNTINTIGPHAFHTIKHLKNLRLSMNLIAVITHDTFADLEELMFLDLAHNQINYLDSKMIVGLKSLHILSLSYNQMIGFDYKVWSISHKSIIEVYLDGNKFTCDWLSEAIRDFENGFSIMRPSTSMVTKNIHSLMGIHCSSDNEVSIKKIADRPYLSSDDKILIVVQKILKTMQVQNFFLRNILNSTHHQNSAVYNNYRNGVVEEDEK